MDNFILSIFSVFKIPCADALGILKTLRHFSTDSGKLVTCASGQVHLVWSEVAVVDLVWMGAVVHLVGVALLHVVQATVVHFVWPDSSSRVSSLPSRPCGGET